MASQPRLVFEPPAQSWRSRCELRQLAVRRYRDAKTVSSRTVSRCTRLRATIQRPHALTLAYAGLPNYPYHVQVASNLASAVWANLAGYPTNANSAGLFIFTDTNTANLNPRYYRIVSP